MNQVLRISLAMSSALFLAVAVLLGRLPGHSTFVCENAGLHCTCDAATQDCVDAPASVNRVTVASASGARCPSETGAGSLAGCTTPFKPSCSGSSSAGIVVTCAE